MKAKPQPRRIQLSRQHGWKMPANTRKVDRTTKWGNPFKVGAWLNVSKGTKATAEDCVRLFRHNLLKNPELIALVKKELRGKNLACWCKEGPCHAEILLKLANE